MDAHPYRVAHPPAVRRVPWWRQALCALGRHRWREVGRWQECGWSWCGLHRDYECAWCGRMYLPHVGTVAAGTRRR
jgi:hypothetical protein